MSAPSQPLTTATTTGPSQTAITIGDKQYEIDISKIPYLSSFVDFQKKINPESTEFIHDAIPLFDVALKGITSGYRQCFQAMPTATDLSQYHTLCETYEFLGVDVFNGGRQSTDSLFTDLKAGKSDYEREYKHRYTEIKGDKSKARDAAFKLLYLMLVGEFTGDEVKDSVKIFNAVLFVVSHSGTFRWKARSVVRAAYQERFVVSGKQMARLDQCEKGEGAERVKDDDATTDDEVEDFCFNSDDSGGWDS